MVLTLTYFNAKQTIPPYGLKERLLGGEGASRRCLNMTCVKKASPSQVLAFAEIKSAIADFESGDINLLDAISRVRDAILSQDCSSDPQEKAA